MNETETILSHSQSKSHSQPPPRKRANLGNHPPVRTGPNPNPINNRQPQPAWLSVDRSYNAASSKGNRGNSSSSRSSSSSSSSSMASSSYQASSSTAMQIDHSADGHGPEQGPGRQGVGKGQGLGRHTAGSITGTTKDIESCYIFLLTLPNHYHYRCCHIITAPNSYPKTYLHLHCYLQPQLLRQLLLLYQCLQI